MLALTHCAHAKLLLRAILLQSHFTTTSWIHGPQFNASIILGQLKAIARDSNRCSPSRQQEMTVKISLGGSGSAIILKPLFKRII